MANRRVIVRRRVSVRNIRKITRTMQLIATARFQASYTRATGTKPYVEKLEELVNNLTSSAGEVMHPLMAEQADVRRSVLLVLTSNRGLCGSYNANVLRASLEHLAAGESSGEKNDLYVVGKKGANYFRFLGHAVHERVTKISDAPQFAQVQPLADALMKRFTQGEIASVHVAYMRFHSMGQQRAAVLQLLPLSNVSNNKDNGSRPSPKVEYEFSPEPRRLLNELLPASVRVRLFQCFMDATVSEQIARMVAMKAATDAAGEMITSLTRQYNRARQTAITLELLDIVGGANALA